MAEVGADLLLVEMMRDIENASSAMRAAVGLDFKCGGISCEIAGNGPTGTLLDVQETSRRALEFITAMRDSLVAVMHTPPERIPAVPRTQ